MRIEVTMPRMGQGMEEGTILRWLKLVGAAVRRGDALIEIETDKATVEIEAFASGTLAEIRINAGESVPIGAVLGYIEAQEFVSAAPAAAPAASAVSSPAASSTAAPRPPISPVAQRLAHEHGLDISTLSGTGPGGRIVREDVEAAARRGVVKPARLDVSPLARRLAHEHGLDLTRLVGSAPNGRIIKRDIVAALAAPPVTAPAPAAAVVVASAPAASQRQPLSRIRRLAAARMRESKTRIPHFYLTLDVNLDRALLLRDSLRGRGLAVSINDLVLKAAALALVAYPTLNSTLDGDDLILNPAVNLALAVALGERAHPDGLITPVVHGCEALTLTEIAGRAAAVVERTRDGKLKTEDLEGGTFTVSNLGMYGIRVFSAIINPPQVAILAVGALQKRPVFDAQERVVAAHEVSLTLSADHRVTDGAEAAGFLGVVKDALEDAFVLAQ